MVGGPGLRCGVSFTISWRTWMLYLDVGPFSPNQSDLETYRRVLSLLVDMDEALCDSSSFNNVAAELNKKSATPKNSVHLVYFIFTLISHEFLF